MAAPARETTSHVPPNPVTRVKKGSERPLATPTALG